MIKADIMGMFHDFHARSKFEKSLHVTFIALSFRRNPGLLILRNFVLLVL
jgi:hypothetical protein